MYDDLIDAALKRLRNTPPRASERVLRRGKMIEAILDKRRSRLDACRAVTGVRLDDAALRS